jgi:hypothetical protein
MFHTYVEVFYLDITYVCNGFQMFFKCFCKCFRSMFQVFYLSFFCMLQVLYLDVLKVDRMSSGVDQISISVSRLHGR